MREFDIFVNIYSFPLAKFRNRLRKYFGDFSVHIYVKTSVDMALTLIFFLFECS